MIPAVARRYGGPSTAVLQMARSLRESGVEVLLATTDADGPDRLAVPLETELEREGVPSIFFPKQWSEALKYSRPLARWLDANVSRFDVVHVHAVFNHACVAAASACQKRGVPYLMRPLGTLDPWSLAQKRLKKRVFLLLGARRALEGAAAIHYTSEHERRLSEAALSLTRGLVIPLGVEDEFFQSGDSPRQDAVVAVSRLHPKKNFSLLIEAFAAATTAAAATRAGDLAHWRLVLGGDGEEGHVQELKERAERSSAAGRIDFLGWVSGARRAEILRGGRLMALPSSQENFGLSVAEAMAAGLPAIVSPAVNLCDEIEAAGAGWVVPAEKAALTAALSSALRDRAELERRGAAAAALAAARFRWSAVAEELRSLYGTISAAGR